MKPIAAFLWRKLDHPGHDSCRLFKLPRGSRLSGVAVFWDNHKPCHFQYEVEADEKWRTRRASVVGYLGNKAIDLSISSSRGGGWMVGGEVQDSFTDCIDVDLGFTPATNLTVLRRLALRIGQRAETPAAYLSFPKMRFERLPQTYRRISRTQYEYEAPSVGYAGTLQVLASGAVVHYPDLFELVTSG